MSDFLSKLIIALITGAVSIGVCLVNNRYQNRRHVEDMREQERKRADEINAKQDRSVQELKAEFTQHLEELITSQSELAHAVDMIKMQLTELGKDVIKHNQVIERTYALERKTDVQGEQIKVANNRIKDLEALANAK